MRAIKNATDNGEHSQFTLNAKALIMQFSFVRKGSGKAPCYIYKNHAVLMENRVSERRIWLNQMNFCAATTIDIKI